MRKHKKLERDFSRVASILLAMAFIAPLIGAAQTNFPLRIRGNANLNLNYADGILSVEFRPATAKADSGLQPGEGSWLDRALNRNEPHVLKQKLSEDEAQSATDYLRNPDHYATFYCANTNQGYFQAANSEPFVSQSVAAQPPNAAANAAPARQVADGRDALPTFSNPDVNAFIKTYEQFAKDYLDAIKAMNSGDDSKIQAMADRSTTMLDTIPKIAALLKEDEKTKYTAYLNGWKDKLEAATKK
ncbi:MAG: hypothetical protein WBZ19_19290 [Chthoniobacterales bacterium]